VEEKIPGGRGLPDTLTILLWGNIEREFGRKKIDGIGKKMIGRGGPVGGERERQEPGTLGTGSPSPNRLARKWVNERRRAKTDGQEERGRVQRGGRKIRKPP